MNINVDLLGKVLLGIGINLWLFFAPIYPLILVVGAFIVTDTIFGVVSSYINKEEILSRKFARLVSKVIIYTALILLVYALDNVILSHFYSGMAITRVASGVLVFIEGFSIDEKIRKMNNDKGVVFYLRQVASFVKDFKSEFNSVIKDEKNR